jgi:hypothetical protein
MIVSELRNLSGVRGEERKRNDQVFQEEQIVIDMTEDYVGMWHQICFDSLFTSAKTRKLLAEKRIKIFKYSFFNCGSSNFCGAVLSKYEQKFIVLCLLKERN